MEVAQPQDPNPALRSHRFREVHGWRGRACRCRALLHRLENRGTAPALWVYLRGEAAAKFCSRARCFLRDVFAHNRAVVVCLPLVAEVQITSLGSFFICVYICVHSPARAALVQRLQAPHLAV